MKTSEQKSKTTKDEFRTLSEFNKRFYPKQTETEGPEVPDPDEVAEKLAKESLNRLQAALSVQ